MAITGIVRTAGTTGTKGMIGIGGTVRVNVESDLILLYNASGGGRGLTKTCRILKNPGNRHITWAPLHQCHSSNRVCDLSTENFGNHICPTATIMAQFDKPRHPRSNDVILGAVKVEPMSLQCAVRRGAKCLVMNISTHQSYVPRSLHYVSCKITGAEPVQIFLSGLGRPTEPNQAYG
nr:hypothetical protein CFP56_22582 [Quercus suber]